MTIVDGSTVTSSGMGSADRHGASCNSVKLPTDLGVCPRAYWTHLTIAPARSRWSSSLGFSAAVTPARGKRVIALTAALYADGELKGRKP